VKHLKFNKMKMQIELLLQNYTVDNVDRRGGHRLGMGCRYWCRGRCRVVPSSRPSSCCCYHACQCRLLSYCPPVVCFEPLRRGQFGRVVVLTLRVLPSRVEPIYPASRWFAAVLGVVGPGVLREMVVSGRPCAYKIIGDVRIGLTLADSPFPSFGTKICLLLSMATIST
jgi:hypothetical protein